MVYGNVGIVIADIVEAVDRIRSSRILFGHQSVGLDLLTGINEYLEAAGLAPLEFVSVNQVVGGGKPFICSVQVGKNQDPLGKCADFEDIVLKLTDVDLDLAFFKLCYIDINRNSDVDTVFQCYRDTLTRLAQACPETIFAAIQLPLRKHQRGPGVLLRELIGRNNLGRLDNQRRNEFNRLFKASELPGPLFRLAVWESTDVRLKRCTFAHSGKTYFALCDDFTNDGGHLNRAGRYTLGERFIEELAIALKK